MTKCAAAVDTTAKSPRKLWFLLLASALLAAAPACGATGNENWDDRFGPPGIDNTVLALAVSGTNLYVGGALSTVGGLSVTNIAKWNGRSWSTLGSGLNGWVQAIAVHGSDVYVAGDFITAGNVSALHVAKWNGSAWSALGTGIAGEVRAIAVTDTGDVYVGGGFTVADGAPANYIAKWNGSTWVAVGGELSQGVNVIAVSGNDVYVGGYFQDAGVLTVNNIAKWDGSSWSKLDNGVNSSVTALAISGGNVYVGGQFTKASGLTANRIAKWTGSEWSALGTGLDDWCWELAASGSDVYASGLFVTAGGITAHSVAKWNGSAWSALGTGMEDGGPGALAIMGTDVYFGGHFEVTGGVRTMSLARWNGSRWFALGNGLSDGALAAAGSGTDVIVGGMFTHAGGVPANRIARWDGESWNALGSGLNDRAYAVAATGSVVYAGGDFTTPGNHIAKWNGSMWSALGSGVNSQVLAIAIVGADVYVGGHFTAPVNHIAKWNGSSWSALGDGVTGPVQALAVIGTDLYVGGQFLNAGSLSVNHIAKWNGSSWSALGGGVNSWVQSLAVNGTDLYASGWFNSPATRIAKWDGASWSTLGGGLDAAAMSLAATGNRLYAGGVFTNVGNHIAVWNGSDWSPLGSGVESTVYGLALAGTNVYVAGFFDTAGEMPSKYFARWFSSGSCPSALNPVSATLSVAATNASLVVTAAGDCAWNATANAAWLHTSSSGSGNGTVNYSVDANPGSGFRTGTITIGERTFTVHQAGINSTPPTAVCQNVVVVADATCHAIVLASAVDNHSFDDDGTIVSWSLTPSMAYPRGVTGVMLTVTDNDGLTDSCGAAITVEDHTPPVIICPGNITTNLPGGVSNAVVHFNLSAATDNCGTVSVVAAPPSGSTFALGTTPVIAVAGDASGNTNACTFNVTVQSVAPTPHDIAVTKLKAPKNINLKAATPALTKRAVVQIQNRSPQSETISSLTGLVTLVAESLINKCPNAQVVLHAGPPNVLPKTLKPKQKMNVFFDVTFDCANDNDKGVGHEDFRYLATVHHEALDGEPDTHPACDTCPRPPLPGGVDPNPDPNKPLKDKGCGNKDKATGQVGADVKTDVVWKQ